jgi:SAM-dependent methyltransferase
MDARLQRRVQRYGWDRAAQHYGVWLSRLEPATKRLLERAAVRPGERVLDVACGTGVLALSAARSAGAQGLVVGTDLSEKMVEAARASAAALSLANYRFEHADAEMLPDFGIEFDVALCGLGLMYVPDPERALRGMADRLRPGGRLAASVWGARQRCGWAEIFPIVDARVKSDVCPLFFRLGTGDALRRALEGAGLSPVEIERIPATCAFDNAEEACDAAFLGGPVALAYGRFDESARAAVRREYLASIEPFRRGEGYDIPGEFVVGCGVKAG